MKFNAFLCDMNLGIHGDDERRIDFLAQDLLCFKGAQLAVDITLRRALCTSAEEDGAVLAQARRDKEATHPDQAMSPRGGGHRDGRALE